ncbi:hypothetical protein ACQKOE_13395 [Novosphingobium sp. NPDC080210]|uniref:hypothetical protein n=1 Tax=Novosphingobium sp. NPDC080210 TaxID=3390596 RepID=UPI003D079431
MYNQLQPFWQLGNCNCKAVAKFLVGQDREGIGPFVGKGRVAVGIGVIDGFKLYPIRRFARM